jgi:hypothetical protein
VALFSKRLSGYQNSSSLHFEDSKLSSLSQKHTIHTESFGGKLNEASLGAKKPLHIIM